MIEAPEHRKLAVSANNSAWDLVEKAPAERTPEESESMIRLAYVAAHHWEHAEGRGPIHEARALSLISRAWHAYGNGPLALRYGQRCVALLEELGATDFDLAYACDGLARAFALNADMESAQAWSDRAKTIPIENEENRVYTQREFAKPLI
jgi:hypothetical protein